MPARIKTSGRVKALVADTGISNVNAMMPAEASPSPANASPNPINLATKGILSLGIWAIW